LNGWYTRTLQNGVSFHGGNSKYCAGSVGDAVLTGTYSWVVTDGGVDSSCPDTTLPTITLFSPLDDSIGLAPSDSLMITFDENVDVERGNITIKRSDNDSIVEVIDVTSPQVAGTGTTNITINPTNDFDLETEYYVEIDAVALDDTFSNSYAGIADKTTWSFTTGTQEDAKVIIYGASLSDLTVN